MGPPDGIALMDAGDGGAAEMVIRLAGPQAMQARDFIP
jgi:hypothetical protein